MYVPIAFLYNLVAYEHTEPGPFRFHRIEGVKNMLHDFLAHSHPIVRNPEYSPSRINLSTYFYSSFFTHCVNAIYYQINQNLLYSFVIPICSKLGRNLVEYFYFLA